MLNIKKLVGDKKSSMNILGGSQDYNNDVDEVIEQESKNEHTDFSDSQDNDEPMFFKQLNF